ncbi:NAD(P)/FAD-dependent oxidoreductase [Tessaracoccus sp. MC1865]|uniref:type III sulfide quinone reductase, selenoprotein subtype n=1 Tax=Tessaracoccus sp. MC1865 TaxID=2760310 RepID=UPI001601640F|nr:FAD/NAD(P)-binding oxidoreductase [Tessaracoccus sp. MC1865]MBB1484681.1 NAD(P)/FAD-dependent oxidoreductase [Tessaracoccus sp. MC1865]QTO36374.1 NAD(P)/FAD-dependent oxidoreductase [Tessaracoccus sp. MC1865]
MKRLLILGGGTAGTMVANKLRAVHPPEELAITVIDRDNDHHYQPGYLFLPFGIYTPDKIVEPRRRYLPRDVDLVLGEIDRIAVDSKSVLLADGRELPWDTLVIATGVQPRPDLTPGADSPDVHHFYDLPASIALRDAMRDFRGGRLVIHLTDMPIKCPVAPLEFTFLADGFFRDRKSRHKVEIVYVTPLDGAFTKPVASRELGSMFAERDIALETDFAVERVDTDAKELVSYDDRRIPYDLLVSIPLNLGPEYISRSGLGDELNLVPCDQQTMRADAHPDIFVLGDGGTLPTSKAGSVAHFSVDVFLDNWPHYLKGEPLPHSFDGHANCFIETGHGKGMLLDFNYETQPYTGTFPLPVVGPMRLLGESRSNHLAKLAFRWVYWQLLLKGRPLPFTTDMLLLGKRLEGDSSGLTLTQWARKKLPLGTRN